MSAGFADDQSNCSSSAGPNRFKFAGLNLSTVACTPEHRGFYPYPRLPQRRIPNPPERRAGLGSVVSAHVRIRGSSSFSPSKRAEGVRPLALSPKVVRLTRCNGDVARFVVESQQEADFAIVVADAWQGLGLGRELMSRLVAAARRYGLRKVSGHALATNTGVLALARRFGFAALRLSGTVTTLRLDLQRTS